MNFFYNDKNLVIDDFFKDIFPMGHIFLFEKKKYEDHNLGMRKNNTRKTNYM